MSVYVKGNLRICSLLLYDKEIYIFSYRKKFISVRQWKVYQSELNLYKVLSRFLYTSLATVNEI